MQTLLIIVRTLGKLFTSSEVLVVMILFEAASADACESGLLLAEDGATATASLVVAAFATDATIDGVEALVVAVLEETEEGAEHERSYNGLVLKLDPTMPKLGLGVVG